jgi:hypothetical protein
MDAPVIITEKFGSPTEKTPDMQMKIINRKFFKKESLLLLVNLMR